MDFVNIPYVYEEFTRGDDRVIVMERLFGTRLHDIMSDSEKAEYGPLVARFSMKSILYDRRYMQIYMQAYFSWVDLMIEK